MEGCDCLHANVLDKCRNLRDGGVARTAWGPEKEAASWFASQGSELPALGPFSLVLSFLFLTKEELASRFRNF